MTKRAKLRPATRSSWDIYLTQHSPAKWIGTVEAVDKSAAIEEAADLFKANDPRKLIAVQRR
jgi:Ser/Thr protein kinase RdoA (MazF antagonist)